MPRFHQVLTLTAVALAAVGCGPSQADIDRANQLNALSEQRAAQEALEYLDEQDAKKAVEDPEVVDDAPATTESPADADLENK